MADQDDVLADAGIEEEMAPEAGSGAGAGSSSAAAAESHRIAEKKKGRGGRDAGDDEDRYAGKSGMFESLEHDGGPGPAKCVHEEAQEDQVLDTFAEFGTVRNINVNLDRRTGFVKGYVLIEYANRKEAEAAIAGMNNKDFLGKPVKVDWAFVKEDSRAGGHGRGGRDRRR